MVDAVINIASIIGGVDFFTEGRHLGKLGLSHLPHEEIKTWLAS
jgi:hypothetical protein